MCQVAPTGWRRTEACTSKTNKWKDLSRKNVEQSKLKKINFSRPKDNSTTCPGSITHRHPKIYRLDKSTKTGYRRFSHNWCAARWFSSTEASENVQKHCNITLSSQCRFTLLFQLKKHFCSEPSHLLENYLALMRCNCSSEVLICKESPSHSLLSGKYGGIHQPADRVCERACTFNATAHTFPLWRYLRKAGWAADERSWSKIQKAVNICPLSPCQSQSLTNMTLFWACSLCPHWANQSHFRCWKVLKWDVSTLWICQNRISGTLREMSVLLDHIPSSQHVTLSNTEPQNLIL